MGESLGDAVLELSTDDSKLRSGLNSAEGDVHEHFGRMAAIGVAAGELIAEGVTVGAEKIKEFVSDAIKGAESLQKSTEVINSTFGSSSKAVLEFGESAAKSFGVSAASADATSAKFGILFQNMGVGKAAAADMTVQWETLAGSLEKVKGVDAATAMDAMTKAAEGNTRGLKDLGIVINSHMVLLQAQADGYKGTAAGMDTATKSQAILELAMKQASGTIAEAKQHTGDLADQQRVLSAEWSNAKDELGTALLPVLATLTGFLADNLPVAIDAAKQGFEAIKPTIETIIAYIGGDLPRAIEIGKTAFNDIKDAAEKVFNLIMSHQTLFEMLGAAIGAVAIALGVMHVAMTIAATVAYALEGAMILLNAVMEANPFVLIATLLIALGAALVVLYEKNETFRRIVQEVWHDVQAAISATISFLEGLWDRWGAQITSVARSAFETVKTVVSGAMTFIKGVIDTVTAVIHGDWGKAWHGIEEIFSGAWKAMHALIEAQISIFQAAASKLIRGIESVFTMAVADFRQLGVDMIQGLINGMESLAQKAADAGKHIVEAPYNAAKNFLSSLSPSKLYETLGNDTVQGYINGVDAKTPDAVKSMHKTVAEVKDAIAGNQNEIEVAAKLLGVKTVQGIMDGVAGVQPTMKQQLHDQLVDGIKQKLQEAQAAVDAAKGTFQSSFSSLAQGVVAGFNSGMTGWVSPAQKLLNKAELQDQAAEYQKQLHDAMEKITDDKTRILEDAANGDYADQVAAEDQLTADQAAYQALTRQHWEQHLAQVAAKQTAAHTQAQTEQSAHLSALLTQLQAQLPGHLKEWVNNHADILADGGKFSAASFIAHDSLLSGLLSKLQTSLAEHPKTWKKTHDEILALIASLEPKYQDAGAKNADAHRLGIASKHDDTVRTTQGIVDDAHDAITSQEGRWYDAGASIGNALANGLRDAGMKAVGDAASDIASTIAGFFSMHSPAERGPLSKLPNWGAYFLPGLRELQPELERHVEVLAGTVRSGAVPRGGGGTGGTGGGDIVLMVDREVLGRVSREELNRKARAGATLFVNPITA